jgi:hypothetical protein
MMQAGNYYIGDLCYVLHEVWDEVCGIMFKDMSNDNNGEFTLKDGRQFAVYGTAWGDGTYKDQYGNRYSVDAGIIGCILVSDIKLISEDWWSNDTDGGNVIEFKFDFVTQCNDGMIQFGHIMIDTDATYDDYEYDGQPDEAQEWESYDPDC